MTVRIGPHVLPTRIDVKPGRDRTVDDARTRASQLLATQRFRPMEAIVDHANGLVLLDDHIDVATKGLHLSTPRCGVFGERLDVAVDIIMLFKLNLKRDTEEVVRNKLLQSRYAFFLRPTSRSVR